jgi:hypothetical protein
MHTPTRVLASITNGAVEPEPLRVVTATAPHMPNEVRNDFLERRRISS